MVEHSSEMRSTTWYRFVIGFITVFWIVYWFVQQCCVMTIMFICIRGCSTSPVGNTLQRDFQTVQHSSWKKTYYLSLELKNFLTKSLQKHSNKDKKKWFRFGVKCCINQRQRNEHHVKPLHLLTVPCPFHTCLIFNDLLRSQCSNQVHVCTHIYNHIYIYIYMCIYVCVFFHIWKGTFLLWCDIMW